ncbi:MAG: type III PLP-dependent enzyme [Candidatus Sulfotelmatobacter sp.]
MSIPEFATPYWRSNAAGELIIGGLTVSSLAARHGTPVFVYDRAVVDKKLLALRNALPPRFAISYSVKANPNPTFLRLFLEHGCGLEIASAGEFFQALNAGCFPANILFAGPGKTEAELELVIARGIGEIHAESELEIERIAAISRKLDVRTRVAVRVNPSEEGQGGAMLMGGKSVPFGVDEEQLAPLLCRIADHQHLDFCGIHLFAGTQILDHRLLIAQYEKGLEISRRVAAQMNAPLRTLDFGGGLGIPYFAGDAELDLSRLREGLYELMAGIEGEDCFAQTRFVVEPGRFLVGEAGVYVARINDIKVSRGKKYLILDEGMNHHLAASGNLGQIIKRNFPMVILNKIDVPAAESVDVAGPLCTPLDTLGRSVQLPRAEVGDLVGIFQSGAYARTASPLGFLSHPTPPEVWVEHDEDFVIRSRGTPEDYFADIRQLGVGEPAV